MHLTREEERILKGEEGEVKARALEVIVRVGEALGADRLVTIRHAHISGVSYANIGDAGADLLESFSDARVSVPTTVNPIGYDEENTWLFTLDPRFLRGQTRILKALKRIGADLTLTCTPYEVPDVAGLSLSVGDHVAWGESSAVLYANSVLGLRTNREGGPIALMAAIAGRTYYNGLHLDEERIPAIKYSLVKASNLDEAEAGVLGEMIAHIHRSSKPPLLTGVRLGIPQLKELLAAAGSAGAVGMIHIEGITPEKPPRDWKPEETIHIEYKDITTRLEELTPDDPGSIEMAFIGCPHAGVEELRRLLSYTERYTGPPSIPLVVAVPRPLTIRPEVSALISRLRSRGVTIIKDTCVVVSGGFEGRRLVTNSYKTYFYLRRRGLDVYLSKTVDLVRTAFLGR